MPAGVCHPPGGWYPAGACEPLLGLGQVTLGGLIVPVAEPEPAPELAPNRPVGYQFGLADGVVDGAAIDPDDGTEPEDTPDGRGFE